MFQITNSEWEKVTKLLDEILAQATSNVISRQRYSDSAEVGQERTESKNSTSQDQLEPTK